MKAFAVVIASWLWIVPALAAKPVACSDGRFLLPDGLAVLAPAVSGVRQAVVLAEGRLTLEGRCDSAKAKVKAGRRATAVGARWRTCGDGRKVRFSGSIASPACDLLKGKLKAAKRAAVSIDAERSRCGDGYADTAGGETCDVSGGGAEPTPASISAARDAIAAGGTDVPISPDGSLRFRRTASATGGTDEVVRGSSVLVRWVHDGDVTTMIADSDGDGTNEIESESRRAPSRSVVLRTDFNEDGIPETVLSMMQVGADGVQVEIGEAGQSPVGYSAPLLDVATEPEAGRARARASATFENCTSTQEAGAQAALDAALLTGLQCLRDLGLGSVAKALEGKVVRDGVTMRCGGTSDCAQIDVLDGVTGGFIPTSIGITLGSTFGVSGTCTNAPMIVFHELLHLGFGAAHSPFLDRSTFEGLATDRVYSCTDLCFRPGKATKAECAKCLGVDRCDPKCDRFADGSEGSCEAFVDIETLTCPTASCQCCDLCPAGIRWTERFEGVARGAEGVYLRVNLAVSLDDDLQCSDWTPAPCPGQAGAFLRCCQRQPGQPASTRFTGTRRQPPSVLPINCICPPPGPPTGVEYVAQVVPANSAVEDTIPVTCP